MQLSQLAPDPLLVQEEDQGGVILLGLSQSTKTLENTCCSGQLWLLWQKAGAA